MIIITMIMMLMKKINGTSIFLTMFIEHNVSEFEHNYINVAN